MPRGARPQVDGVRDVGGDRFLLTVDGDYEDALAAAVASPPPTP